MNLLNRMSIQSKLILMLLSVSILSVVTIAILAYLNGSSSLTNSVSNQLISIRSAKAQRIEAYFQTIENQVVNYSRALAVINAMKSSKAGFYYLDEQVKSGRVGVGAEGQPIDYDQTVRDYYRTTVLKVMPNYFSNASESEMLLPGSLAGRYLQYHYTMPSEDWDQRAALDKAPDNSTYSATHERYHPFLRDFVVKFGYEDLFLIDHINGDIVYSVYKGLDFGANLIHSPYATSGLARVVAKAQRQELNSFAIEDFQPYIASYGDPQAFIAAPIYEGTTMIGVLVLQISKGEIDKIMTNDRQWELEGLGKTGETYLVADDYLMRSNSRLMLTDIEQYLAQIRATGVPEKTLEQIQDQQSTILLQEVRTAQVELALNEQSGVRLDNDYRDVPVLASYAPLRIKGLHWAIIAELDQAEAIAPIHDFTRIVLISTALLILAITILAMWLSNLFVKPIHRLIEGAHRIAEGDLSTKIESGSRDEFKHLADSLNLMAEEVREKSTEIASKEQEYEALLHSVLPSPIAKRYRAKEGIIVDTVPNVTMLYADLGGFVNLTEQTDAARALTILNSLIQHFDEAAERLGVERIKTSGSAYLAASGLSVPRLDHASRVLQMATEMQKIVDRVNLEQKIELTLHVGIHSGPVSAGVVGKKKFIYDVWGDTVSTAVRMGSESKAARTQKKEDSILVTQPIYDRLQTDVAFTANGKMTQRNGSMIPTWYVKSE